MSPSAVNWGVQQQQFAMVSQQGVSLMIPPNLFEVYYEKRLETLLTLWSSALTERLNVFRCVYHGAHTLDFTNRH